MNVIISAREIPLVVSKSFLYNDFWDLRASMNETIQITAGIIAKTKIKNIFATHLQFELQFLAPI